MTGSKVWKLSHRPLSGEDISPREELVKETVQARETTESSRDERKKHFKHFNNLEA